MELHDSSVFLGFDDELELAVYSSEIYWRNEGEFEFSGMASSRSELGFVPVIGHGRARPSAESEPILETEWEESELHFQAYSNSNARYFQFELEGSVSGEMHLVVDGSGSGYGLIVEDSDFLHGGRVIPSDTGTHLFYTRRGDKLEFDLGAEEFTYEFSAGENGYLRVIAPDSNERDEVAEPAMLSSVWNAF